MRQNELISVLRKIGSTKTLKKADELAATSTRLGTLHLRNLSLRPEDVNSIIKSISAYNKVYNNSIKSISLSHNKILDQGAIQLVKHLPDSIQEVGLVDCGISDAGGLEILKWMRTAPQLKMICMEQNNFSKDLQNKIKAFVVANPNILLFY